MNDPTMSPLLSELARLQQDLDKANASIDEKLDRLEDALVPEFWGGDMHSRKDFGESTLLRRILPSTTEGMEGVMERVDSRLARSCPTFLIGVIVRCRSPTLRGKPVFQVSHRRTAQRSGAS